MATWVPRTTLRFTLTTCLSAHCFDHLPQHQPFWQHQARPSSTACVHRVTECPQEGGDVTGQIVYTDQDARAARIGTDHLHQVDDQPRVPSDADHPTQLQPRRHRHGYRHPDSLAHHLYLHLVGLDVTGVRLPLLNDVLVDPLAALAHSRLTGSHGALVQAEGGDNGAYRAAKVQQGEHDHHQVRRLVQSLEGRPLGGNEGLSTGVAHIAAFLLTLDADVALPNLPSGGAGLVVTELARRIEPGLPSNDWSVMTPVREQTQYRSSTCSYFNHG